jgi:hypothetical protein
MSGLGKKLKRRAIVRAARAQRAASAGGGRVRRPLASWVETTEQDIVHAALMAAAQRQTEGAADADDHTDD